MTTFATIIGALGGKSDDQTPVDGVSTSTAPKPNTLSFVRQWSDEAANLVAAHESTLFLVPSDCHGDHLPSNAFAVQNPRLAYAKVLRDVMAESRVAGIASTSVIDANAQLDDDVSIGHFSVIEAGVVLGPGCTVGSHTVLKSGVVVGARSSIGSHTVIGGFGFGFENDEGGEPIRIDHRGGVVIGDDVEIGSHVVIAQGTIDPTTICDQVKIVDCVFIAHNVRIGAESFVIAGAEISGSVTIGERVWISPEATVINKVVIGDDALVGIGAVVVDDVAANTVVAGVPAKPLGPRHTP